SGPTAEAHSRSAARRNELRGTALWWLIPITPGVVLIFWKPVVARLSSWSLLAAPQAADILLVVQFLAALGLALCAALLSMEASFHQLSTHPEKHSPVWYKVYPL